MNIGTLELVRIVESEFPVLSPFEAYPDCTPEHLVLNRDWLVPRFYDPNSQLLILAFQQFVIRSGEKTLLVGTCVGDCKPRRRPSFGNQRWNCVDRREIAGFAPKDIDCVLCTHFHVDHLAWLLMEDGFQRFRKRDTCVSARTPRRDPLRCPDWRRPRCPRCSALAAHFPCGGWCPEGWKAEDGPIPVRYPVTELPGAYYPRPGRWGDVPRRRAALRRH